MKTLARLLILCATLILPAIAQASWSATTSWPVQGQVELLSPAGTGALIVDANPAVSITTAWNTTQGGGTQTYANDSWMYDLSTGTNVNCNGDPVIGFANIPNFKMDVTQMTSITAYSHFHGCTGNHSACYSMTPTHHFQILTMLRNMTTGIYFDQGNANGTQGPMYQPGPSPIYFTKTQLCG